MGRVDIFYQNDPLRVAIKTELNQRMAVLRRAILEIIALSAKFLVILVQNFTFS